MKANHLLRAFGNSTPQLPDNAATVPLVKQKTDYSCGPAALLAVLRYFGADAGASEKDLYGELGTTSKWGTSPEPMADAASWRGLDASYEVGFSLDNLRSVLGAGGVAIVGIQAWPDSEDEVDVVWDAETGEGHYVVAIGVDAENVYCMDPSLEGAYGYMPVDEFASRWHDVEANGEFEYHPAIVVYGQAADDEPTTRDVALMG